MNLLVNNNNTDRLSCAKLVKQQLENAGFSVNIVEAGFDEYTRYVENENFNLYIGEIKLTNDMNLNAFFTNAGTAKYGIDIDGDTSNAYYNYLNGDAELGSFRLLFQMKCRMCRLFTEKEWSAFQKQ